VSEPQTPDRTDPGDAGVERRVLAVTLDRLAEGGVEAVSLPTVAAMAGVDVDHVHLRWPDEAELVTAAVASLLPAAKPLGAAAPFDELVHELLGFRRSVAHPAAMVVAAAALDEVRHPDLARHYREVVVRPQRARLRRVLELAKRQGLLDADDQALDEAVAACTGSWYALAIAGVRPPRDWGALTARLAWRSLGGQPPA
jgi:AcrR family transcriptional regulator